MRPAVLFALALALGCTPGQRQGARDAFEAADAACRAALACGNDEKTVIAACRWEQTLAPIVRALVASRPPAGDCLGSF